MKDSTLPNLPGIYKISIQNHFYYGRSKNIRSRSLEHIRLLNKNKHYNRQLQFAFNKYKSILIEPIILVSEINDQKLYEGWFIENTKNINVANSEFGGGSGKFDTLPPSEATRRRKLLSKSQTTAWKNISTDRILELEKRKSFAYKLNHSKNNFVIHTPYGVFPSLSETIKMCKIGDITVLKSWLNGKVVTIGMVNAMKSKLFTIEDVGKNTNILGWYYVPIPLPNNTECNLPLT